MALKGISFCIVVALLGFLIKEHTQKYIFYNEILYRADTLFRSGVKCAGVK